MSDKDDWEKEIKEQRFYDELDRKAKEDESEKKYFEYCKSNNIDPNDDTNREEYDEILQDNEKFWDTMDEDDRDGWNDNIIKSFD